MTWSSSPITSIMTLEECLARSRRLNFNWLSCDDPGAVCAAEWSMEPDTSRTTMQWMGLRCGFSAASSVRQKSSDEAAQDKIHQGTREGLDRNRGVWCMKGDFQTPRRKQHEGTQLGLVQAQAFAPTTGLPIPHAEPAARSIPWRELSRETPCMLSERRRRPRANRCCRAGVALDLPSRSMLLHPSGRPQSLRSDHSS